MAYEWMHCTLPLSSGKLVGTLDTNTSHTVLGNLATIGQDLGDHVNAKMYWDARHGANEDAPAFIKWIAEATGYGQ